MIENFCQVCRKEELGWNIEVFEYKFSGTSQFKIILCYSCAEKLQDELKQFIMPKSTKLRNQLRE